MADFNQYKPFLLRWEGGFVNHPADPGGATNRGITLNTYTAYCLSKNRPRPTVQDLKAMPVQEWEDIARGMYWNVCKGDHIQHQAIANSLTDFYFHSGVKAFHTLCELMNQPRTNSITATHISYLNSHPAPRAFAEQYNEARRAFFRRLVTARPKLHVFLKGWNARVTALNLFNK